MRLSPLLTSMVNLVLSNVRQREKKFSKLSLVKVNPERWKVRKKNKSSKANLKLHRKYFVLNLMNVLKMCPPSMPCAT